MEKRLTLVLLLLGALALASGCFDPYGRDRYPDPDPCWRAEGLAMAGNAVLHSAWHQSDPGAALAATVVGMGLHAAAGAAYDSCDGYPTRRRRHCRYGFR